jgi:hypothetical protein
MSQLIKAVEFGVYKFHLYEDKFTFEANSGVGMRIFGALFGMNMDTSNVSIMLEDISQVEMTLPSLGGLAGNFEFSVIASGSKPFIFTNYNVAPPKHIIEQLAELKTAIIEQKKKWLAKKNNTASLGSNLDELEKLATLKDKGIITEEEFQKKKKQILGL